jgi:uncharacterized protein (DUF2249 family)
VKIRAIPTEELTAMSLTTPHSPAHRPELAPGTASVLATISAHHAELAQGVSAGALAIRDAADRLVDVTERRDALVLYMLEEVLPHAQAEERTLYAVGSGMPRTALLVAAMIDEHRRLEALVNELARARTAATCAGAALALRSLFEAHLAKENDQLIPVLAEEGVDLARLLEGMHEILGPGESAQPTDGGCGCGGCGCGGGEASAEAEASVEAGAQPGDLDVRAMPPAVRHERIFAMVAELPPGQSFVLCNDHDPVPLRYQLDAEQPGEISWSYLAEGPSVWRVEIGRLPA